MAQKTAKKSKKTAPRVTAKCSTARAGSASQASGKPKSAKPKADKCKVPKKSAPTGAKTANKKKRPATSKGKSPRKDTGKAPAETPWPTPSPVLGEEGGREAPVRLRKSRLTPEELDMFREMLVSKRSELLTTVSQLRDEALHKSRQESAGDLSSMPIHMADIGSDNWEQEFTLGLLANETELLREIDEALKRLDEGSYGVCLATNRHIQKRRLRAKPWAKYCIEYARELELRRGR